MRPLVPAIALNPDLAAADFDRHVTSKQCAELIVRRYVCHEIDARKHQRRRKHRNDIGPEQCFAAIQQPKSHSRGRHQHADKRSIERRLENVDVLRMVECGHEFARRQAEADRNRPDQVECQNAQEKNDGQRKRNTPSAHCEHGVGHDGDRAWRKRHVEQRAQRRNAQEVRQNKSGRHHDGGGRAQPCTEIPAFAGCLALGLARSTAGRHAGCIVALHRKSMIYAPDEKSLRL